MVGSSAAMGDRVRWDKTFAVSLPEVLSRQTGRKVELYNEGVMIRYPHVVAQQVQEALAAKPDMLLWVLTPFDIETETPDHYIEISAENKGTVTRAWSRAMITFSSQSFSEGVSYLWHRALDPLNKLATTMMLQHFPYESESQYVKSCLLGGDFMGYLLARPSDKWKSRLRMFDSDDAEVARQAKAAGVPSVSFLVPMRPQAAILSAGSWPASYAPYSLGNELRAITTSHGGVYWIYSPVSAKYHVPSSFIFRSMAIRMPTDTRSSPACWPKNSPMVRYPHSKQPPPFRLHMNRGNSDERNS
jgi:hypothetical protein